MFALPIGDQPNPRGVPLLNYAFILLNVAVYLIITLPLSSQALDPSLPGVREFVLTTSRATGIHPAALLQQGSAYDLFVFQNGFRPSDPSLWTLFVSMFLHAGFAHLAGNMLFLWIFGDNVEHRLGRFGYLTGYLATGIAATAAHAAFRPASPIPSIGASGAISGVLGYYFVWFPQNRVQMLVGFFYIWDILVIPARYVLGFYLLVENLLPFLLSSAATGVAYGAHIGGFLAGAALAWVADQSRELEGVREGRRGPGGPARPPLNQAAVLDAIEAALAEGRPDEAAALYFRLPPQGRSRLAGDAVLGLASHLDRDGRPGSALSVLRRFIASHPRDPCLAEAHLAAGEILLRAYREPTPAYQHLLAALDSAPPPQVVPRARKALDAVVALQKLVPMRRVDW